MNKLKSFNRNNLFNHVNLFAISMFKDNQTTINGKL